MGNERNDRRIRQNYRSGLYTPHPWDQYVKDKLGIIKVKDIDHNYQDPVVVRTNNGKNITLSPRKISAWDWGSRYETSDCQTCPLFVPPSVQDEEGLIKDQLDPLLRKLRYPRRFPILNSNIDVRGVCLFGRSLYSETVIPKLLVSNPHHPKLRSCNSPLLERKRRDRE